MRVIIDGEPRDDSDAVISVFDWAVIRGFAVFEVVRVYGTRLFRVDPHLARLTRSAAEMGIPAPDRPSLAGAMERLAAANGSGQVRVILTGGGRDPDTPAAPRTVVLWEPLPFVPERVRVLPIVAPWHPGTIASGFPGVKWTSYAPNMATTDRARLAGYDDALLLTTDGIVLEGPTFSYAWVQEGGLETPALDLGILPSITRDVVAECCARLAIPFSEGSYPLERVVGADEVLALSTVKQVTPVELVGESPIPVGPVAAAISAEFAAIVATETGIGE